MTTMIGVAVEGPSDLAFWRKVLHREFQDSPVSFDVHNMSTRPQLIRKSLELLDAFRDARYGAGILIIDRDKNPCAEDLVDEFEDVVKKELRYPVPERYLFLGVAVKKTECWYLADSDAVCAVLDCPQYDMHADTKVWGKGKLDRLCQSVGRSYNERWFAEAIAPKFSPDRAMKHSESFRIAWGRISLAVERASNG